MNQAELFNYIESKDWGKRKGLKARYCIENINNTIYVLFAETGGVLNWVMNILFIPVLAMLPFCIKKSIFMPIFWIVTALEVGFIIFYIIRFIPKKPYKKMNIIWRAHFGINLMWHSIRDDVMQELKSFIDKGYDEIIVAGWSQGGGIAQLCVEDINFQYKIKARLITFGSPRIAWKGKTALRIKDSCTENSKCYENGSDIVPKMPFEFLGFINFLSCQVGEKFNLIKIFKTPKYHKGYGDVKLYE